MIYSILQLTPIATRFDKGRPQVTWCRLGPVAFKEPFFDETVSRVSRGLGSPQILEADLDALRPQIEKLPALEPAGLIFHMSRCGSTLMSQMLASVDENLVIAEAGVINDLFDPLLAPVSRERRVRWLRWMVRGLGQRLRGIEQRFFLKLSSWNILQMSLLLEAFPNVPWVFLHREPIEVLVSLIRKPAGFMSLQETDQQFLGFLQGEQTPDRTLSPEEYGARILGAFCHTALEHLGSQGLVVDYRELPGAVAGRIDAHFGWCPSAQDLVRMQEASLSYSKDPSRNQPFRSDSEEKQAAATPALRQAVERWAAPAYTRLVAAGAAMRAQAAPHQPANPPPG